MGRRLGVLLGIVIALGFPQRRCAAAVPADIPGLCGTRTTAPPTWDHVLWVFFENHSYSEVVGSRAAPFMNRVARSCGLATNYRTLTHPSLPNYIAATSGLALDQLGPLGNDCNATGSCHTNAPSIFAQVPSWRAYAESMRRPCTHVFTGRYAASHNPAVYYRSLTDCATNDVNFHQLKVDLDTNALPAFAFVTPNLCHAMHGCSVTTGDQWLRRFITRVAASAAYAEGKTAIFVTFDESDKDSSDNRIATFVISPSTPAGARTGQGLSHYSLLRTTEEMLGLDQFLGQAARAHSMRAAFGL